MLNISCRLRSACRFTAVQTKSLTSSTNVPRPPPLASSALELIGNTPLVELSRICKREAVEGRILAKCEFLNPGYSKKDRIARQMLEEARANGSLACGQPVVELTSGNTGTGLAICCAVLGHPFIAVMSAGNSSERARMMRALGAEVVIVPQTVGSDVGTVSGEDLMLVERETQHLARKHGAYRADQFALAGNSGAHYDHTAHELWTQSSGQIDAFVDFVGSGGTFGGIAKYLKERRPEIRSFLVEPTGCAVLAADAGQTGHVAEPQPPHQIQGGGYSKDLNDLRASLDVQLVDSFVEVDDAEAIRVARLLASSEGLFTGFSSGANVAAALQLLRTDWGRGKTVSVVLCDSGLKYLSTGLWNEVE